MKIKYWSDFACPYCYIGVTNLKAALKDLGIETYVHMMAFRLDPDIPRDERAKLIDKNAEKKAISCEEVLAGQAPMLKMAEEAGLTINYDQIEYTNTEDAHRLTKYAQSKDHVKADELIGRLYKAYFTDGIWLGDREALADIAAECGFNRTEALQSMGKMHNAETVWNQERVARGDTMKLKGVPYFVFDEKYGVSGAFSREEMRSILTRIVEMEAKDLGIGAGAACGPDGCDV